MFVLEKDKIKDNEGMENVAMSISIEYVHIWMSCCLGGRGLKYLFIEIAAPNYSNLGNVPWN